MLVVSILPTTLAVDVGRVSGFDKGVSYASVVPLKKVTFVNFDEDSYLDDYAYLAAVPTDVFQEDGRLFSYPLLFYQDSLDLKDQRLLSLNARQGLDYFMEDWMEYCRVLDKLTAINVPRSSLDSSWKAKEVDIIEGDDPYSISSEIALGDWSYSDDAVLAVVEEDFEKPDNVVSGKVEGVLPVSEVYRERTMELEQSNSLNPVYGEFDVGDGYKYLRAEAWWDLLILGGMMIPTGDPDLQLYCRQGDDWMQCLAAAKWNVWQNPGDEYAYAHVYEPGLWRVGITDFPTQGDEPPRRNIGPFILQGSLLKALLGGVTYYVDVTMYPGVDVVIPDKPFFGCRDVTFTLKWDNPSVVLGFSVIGPSGEVILTEVNESKTDSQEIHLNQLGELLEGESYSISVFAMGDVSRPVNFEVEYGWQQNILKVEGDSLTSAAEGAVLASVLNAPLLYTSSSVLSESTRDVLYKLGVENVYLVNFGNHLSSSVKEEIKDIAGIKEHYKQPEELYKAVMERTHQNDVIFTTIDPWSYWYTRTKPKGPAGEKEGALYIGPAAYIAAHHGSPVLIVDNHPELSSAVTWHVDFWTRYGRSEEPFVAEMVLTGRRIYDFLGDYGFDKEGMETIITVAGQYDIGITWDRIFPGVANSGRICGTPVDTSYWISRNVFYPALIFVNPALQGEVSLINGSISARSPGGILKKPFGNTLYIKRESREEKYEYPVLCSFVTHKHRFNERASKYYGSMYECANGLIPGVTPTFGAIDEGSIEKYTGKDGSYFPDLTESEIAPFYLKRGGYEVAYSTSLPAVANNLNNGVILWVHGSHGMGGGDGSTEFWDPDFPLGLLDRFAGAAKEENPWRGYEWLLGSTEEPDTMSMDIQGIFPFTNVRGLFLPPLGQDWALARKPVREFLNRIIFPRDPSRPFRVDDLYDGVIGSISFSRYQIQKKNATEIEAELDNLHSVGFVTSICYTANTYFHLMLMRHGCVFQVQDPWPTSWYGAVWRQSIPRDLVLGDTIGEAYTKGISHAGILYISDPPQWWWDTAENVLFYGDPDLRVFVPGTQFSSKNYWEKSDTKALRYDSDVSIGGHMPFGVTGYPHEREPLTFWQQYLWVIIALVVIVLLVIAMMFISRRKK
jgi:hypothetical protein